MNRIQLVGNVCRNPVATETGTGIKVTKFTIAVNRTYGEKETDYIDIVTFRNLAENCAKFLSKGDKVGIAGALRITAYEDSEGLRRTKTEVVAEEVEFIYTQRKEDVLH